MKIGVIVAEDHAFTLTGMQHALSADDRLEVLATARSGIAAIALARIHRPDVAVLDYQMPDANGLDAFLEISRWSPDTRVVIVTASARIAALSTLERAGVHGIFSKSCPISEICEGIVRVASGAVVRSDDIREMIGEPAPDLDISPRELEVLLGVAEGLTNARISERLSISPKTVESHRASLMRKLAVNSTASLLVQAVRRGLIDIGSDGIPGEGRPGG